MNAEPEHPSARQSRARPIAERPGSALVHTPGIVINADVMLLLLLIILSASSSGLEHFVCSANQIASREQLASGVYLCILWLCQGLMI